MRTFPRTCWNKHFLGTGEHWRAFTLVISFLKEIQMDKRNRELLDEQLWKVGPSRSRSGIIIGFITVFLAGISIADILAKTKQANTPPIQITRQ